MFRLLVVICVRHLWPLQLETNTCVHPNSNVGELQICLSLDGCGHEANLQMLVMMTMTNED